MDRYEQINSVWNSDSINSYNICPSNLWSYCLTKWLKAFVFYCIDKHLPVTLLIISVGDNWKHIKTLYKILKGSRDCLLYTKKETNCGLFTVKPWLHYFYLTWKRKNCQNRRYPNQSIVVYIFHKGIISFILCGYEVQTNVYFFILSESPPLIPLHLEPPLLSSLKHVIDNARGLSERDLSGSWFNITQNSFTLTPPSN